MINIDIKIKNLIENNAMALATVNEKSEPNVVAVAFVKVVSSNQILITDNFMNKTRENILKNNKISIAVWDKNQENGFQLKGEAEYLAEGKWKDYIDQMEENKGLAHKAAVLITVKEIWDLGEPKLVCREN